MINETDLEAWGYYKDSTLYKDMTLSSYQKAAAGTAIYPIQHAITYPALGLAGEAGEVANKVKKIIRDGKIDKAALTAEVGDCLWYIAALCRDLNVDMGDVAKSNLDKLYDRKQRGTLQGSGDKR
jgi:NTP pyrophosphatase (non-canonical NTP hydrolase)|tara:strand:- start:1268 stop:1642 length:375 start_codon:yes stop_codon:yes gene_type:complete